MQKPETVILIAALLDGVVSILMILLALARHRKVVSMAGRIVELTIAGRTQDARAQARHATRDLLPVVDALGGALVRPEKIPLTPHALYVLAIIALPFLLTAVAAFALPSDGAPASAVVSLLMAVAVLIPLSITAALIVVGLGQHAARLVRASSITLLARNVKSAVEAEVAEAIRRSATPRDPRGD